MTSARETRSVPSAACGISGHLDTRTAATEVAHELHDTMTGSCDLALMFASFHHRAAFAEAAETIRQTLAPTTMIGVTAESVLGADEELEGLAGLAVLTLSLPGVRIHPWWTGPEDPIRISHPETIPERIGLSDDFRAAIMLAEPFSTPMTRLLPALTRCGGDRPVPIVGGLASGANQPGHNLLVIDETVRTTGAVGVSLAGDVDLDFVVSQGARPIADPLVVTKAKDNVILELGGRRALDALQELASELSEEERQLLTRGLLIGSVVDEYREHFGRGDFLVRSILGYNEKVGGIVVGDAARIGQTVQFHARDARTAAEDLQLLLDAQQLDARPFGALLFTCNGRGTRLFGERNHDLGIIHERLDLVPIAGFFAAGEIGPLGDRSYVHGHTASLTLFRPR
ncbi:MAG: FIST signal transduction protein [Planctomycetota bacterium]|jgi:small ligand-binding sensory domain FIST